MSVVFVSKLCRNRVEIERKSGDTVCMYVCMYAVVAVLLQLLLLLCYYWEVRCVGVACGVWGTGYGSVVLFERCGWKEKKRKRNEKKGRIRVCGRGKRS